MHTPTPQMLSKWQDRLQKLNLYHWYSPLLSIHVILEIPVTKDSAIFAFISFCPLAMCHEYMNVTSYPYKNLQPGIRLALKNPEVSFFPQMLNSSTYTHIGPGCYIPFCLKSFFKDKISSLSVLTIADRFSLCLHIDHIQLENG